MPLLELAHVSKRFGGVRALRDVTFSVDAGEICGLMGANGAGKTTLFSLIAGNARLDEGDIRFEGRSLSGLRPDQICRLGVGRTFQIVKPFAGIAVEDNLITAAYFGAAQYKRRADAARFCHGVLEEFGLMQAARQPAGTLTLSGQKRLELARAVATGAKLVLIDEVMAGLTAPEVTAMLDTVRRVRSARGLTLIVIEHVMRAVMQLADRIVVLHHGERIAEGDPATIAADPHVLRVYLGEAHESTAA
jgi:branched-chain amino acid transport system ATP-binding protein